ncbi:MAG TPA: type 4a pilus biogenesis protein PilO, partial [Blastocatellia bacterium]|nr:type 4a pilus biogenesis protein PilO [Blastocatellia bacterium]
TTVTKTEESGGILSRIPWYLQMLLLLLLVVVLFAVIHLAIYKDKLDQTDKILKEVQALREENKKGSIIHQNIAEAEKTLDQKKQEIERLRDLLPDQVQISRVYNDIKDRMHQQKLELKRFAEMKTAPADYYTAQPIQVEVSGTYDNLGHFFSQLAFYTRIVSVADVEIKQAQDSSQEAGRTIESQFVITAFYISPENLDRLTMKTPPIPAGGAKPGQPAKPGAPAPATPAPAPKK